MGTNAQLRQPILFSSLNQARANSQNRTGTVTDPSSISHSATKPSPVGPGIVASTWQAIEKFIATAKRAGKACQ